jgi:hypothetical protein
VPDTAEETKAKADAATAAAAKKAADDKAADDKKAADERAKADKDLFVPQTTKDQALGIAREEKAKADAAAKLAKDAASDVDPKASLFPGKTLLERVWDKAMAEATELVAKEKDDKKDEKK